MIRIRYIETNNAASFSSLPTRYLAPGSVKMLWHQLVQEKGHANISQLGCAGGHGTLGCPVVWVTKRAIKFTSGCCLRNPRQYCMVIESTKRVGFTSHDLLLSYATFWKTYRAKWSNVLRFQTATTHGVCDTCQEYKEQFRCASGACWLMFGQFWANIFQRSFRENPKTLIQRSETPVLNMPLFSQFFLKVRLSQQKLRTSSCSSTLLVVTKTT